MKLNPDCIRDILIEIEDKTDLETGLFFDVDAESSDRLIAYDSNVLAYHLKQCALNGLLNDFREFDERHFSVGYLTPAGHQLLADIRSDTVWCKTRSVAAKIGVWSLDALTKIATGVVTEIIKQNI